MPHIDIERLVLDFSYHILLAIIFAIGVSLGVYFSNTSLHNVIKLKTNLNIALRYKLRIK